MEAWLPTLEVGRISLSKASLFLRTRWEIEFLRHKDGEERIVMDEFDLLNNDLNLIHNDFFLITGFCAVRRVGLKSSGPVFLKKSAND